jgi:hypothetical protein
VIQRLAPSQRGVDPDAQALFDLILADELGEALRTERELDDGFVGEDFRGGDLSA